VSPKWVYRLVICLFTLGNGIGLWPGWQTEAPDGGEAIERLLGVALGVWALVQDSDRDVKRGTG